MKFPEEITGDLHAEVWELADWIAEGAFQEASWRGYGANYQCSRTLWDVPISVEVGYGEDSVWVMVCGVSQFGAWEADRSYSEHKAGGRAAAIACAFVLCTHDLMAHGGFRLTLAAAMAEREAAALASVANAGTAGDGTRRL